MTQIQVSKLDLFQLFMPTGDDAVTVTKLVAHVWMVPGDAPGTTPARQGFCYAQKLTRG